MTSSYKKDEIATSILKAIECIFSIYLRWWATGKVT